MRLLVPIIAVAAVWMTVSCGGKSAGSQPVPTASLMASRPTVNTGQSVTLTWNSTNAASCTASGGWSGELAASGTQSSGTLDNDTDFSLSCTGAGGTSTAATTTVTVDPVPAAMLSAAPTSVAAGGTSTLTWSSTDATACTASGGWTGSLATSGTQATGALTADTTFSLTCTDPGGASPVASVTVTIAAPPTATLTAAPTTVVSGGTSALTWSSTNATACAASGAWSGALPASGTQSTGVLTATSSFSLTCTGPGGASAAATATITVTPAAASPPLPTVSLSANPTLVATGSASTLTWTSTDATACTATGGWTGALPTAGTRATAALTADTSYSLSCSGPGGSSSATAVVSVSSTAMSVVPKLVALTSTQTQQYTATVPGGGAATWTVDGIAGGNATVGLIGATGLYTAGTAPGTHTIVAITAANAALTATAFAAVTDLSGVYTYHNDISRDGANTKEYALTPTNVNTTSFGKRASCIVDGAIYGQPLWTANSTVGGAKHNVVFVATQHDSLYAFDADASPCVQLYAVSLIDSAHGGLAGETSVPNNLVGGGSGDIQPEIGVTGTPVIDSSAGILYVVSKSVNAAHTTFYQRLHAIDLASGAEKSGSPVTVAGTYPGTGSGGTTVSFDARQELQRAGLAFANGVVYIAWTSHEDRSPWYGWMMSYQYTAGALIQKSVLNTAPDSQKAGIWMSGGAPAVDSSGNLYVLTGNGDFDATNTTAPNKDYGDSLLQLDATLHVSGYFTPTDQLTDAQNDDDFGSGGAGVLADLPDGNTITHALICGGKDGALYVLNRDLLGGLGDPAAVQKIAFGKAIFSTAAMWNNQLYLAGVSGPLVAYRLNTSTAQFTSSSSGSHVFGFPGVTPSVSAAAAQNGVVWALDTNKYCTSQAPGCGAAVLYAYDAANMATELWNSARTTADAAGNGVKFGVPTIANGKVYVGTRGNNIGGTTASTSVPGELDIYGLKP